MAITLPGLVSPLPDELLAMIFSEYVCGLFDSWKTRLYRSHVLRPSHVCRQWRNVAFSTPRLWSHYSIVITPGLLSDAQDPQDALGCITGLTEDWLTRSGTYPLSLFFDIPDTNLDFSPLMESVLSHCQRWREIRLHIPPSMVNVLSSTIADDLASTKRHLPLLEKLYLTGTPATNSLDVVRIDFFESAPRLRTLRWALYISDADQFKFPWQQLERFDLFADNFFVALQIAQSCSNLVKLNIEMAIADDDDLPFLPLPEVKLYQLTSLSFRCFSDPGPLFAVWTLPALRKLDIDCDYTTDVTEQELVTFLFRSNLRISRASLYKEQIFRLVLKTIKAG